MAVSAQALAMAAMMPSDQVLDCLYIMKSGRVASEEEQRVINKHASTKFPGREFLFRHPSHLPLSESARSRETGIAYPFVVLDQ